MYYKSGFLEFVEGKSIFDGQIKETCVLAFFKQLNVTYTYTIYDIIKYEMN